MSSSSNNEFSSSQESEQDVTESGDDRSPYCSDSEELQPHSDQHKFLRCPCGCRDRAEAMLEEAWNSLRIWSRNEKEANRLPNERLPEGMTLTPARFSFLEKLWPLFQSFDHYARKIREIKDSEPKLILAFNLVDDIDDRSRTKLQLKFLPPGSAMFDPNTLKEKGYKLMSDVKTSLLKLPKEYQPIYLPIYMEARPENPRKLLWNTVPRVNTREHTEGTFDIFKALVASFWKDPNIHFTKSSLALMPEIPIKIDFASPTGPDRPKTRPFFSRVTTSEEIIHLTADDSRQNFRECPCGCYDQAKEAVDNYFEEFRQRYNKRKNWDHYANIAHDDEGLPYIPKDNDDKYVVDDNDDVDDNDNEDEYYEYTDYDINEVVEDEDDKIDLFKLPGYNDSKLRERLYLVCQVNTHYGKQVEAWKDYIVLLTVGDGLSGPTFGVIGGMLEVFGATFELLKPDGNSGEDIKRRKKIDELGPLSKERLEAQLRRLQSYARGALNQLDKDRNPNVLGWKVKTYEDEPEEAEEVEEAEEIIRHEVAFRDYGAPGRTFKLWELFDETIGSDFIPGLGKNEAGKHHPVNVALHL